MSYYLFTFASRVFCLYYCHNEINISWDIYYVAVVISFVNVCVYVCSFAFSKLFEEQQQQPK